MGGCLVESGRWRIRWRPVNVCNTQIRTNCTIRAVERFPCGQQRESVTSPTQEGQGSSLANSSSAAMLFWGYRKPRFHYRWCLRVVIRVVPCIINVRHCCEGWTQSWRGLCDERVKKTSKCTRGCENGKCMEDIGTCSCKYGYEGERCEQAVCNPSCENGGVCTSVDGKPQCKCPKAFQGEKCQRAVCQEQCRNGGLCTAVGAQARCTCLPGFEGEACEMLERSGECPPGEPFSRMDSNCGQCKYDSHCPGNQKCCVNPCGRKCQEPAPTSCLYKFQNGTQVIEIGSSFQPDPCTLCTCLEPDPTAENGGAICSTTTCPTITHRCKRQTSRDNHCCPVCDDGNNKPSNYKAPIFIDCPEEAVVIDLPETGRTVDLPQHLHAVDMYNNPLEVQYSKEQLTWQEDLERNFYLIMATANDKWDEMVNCPFMVRVRDPHPPNFEKCPTDISVETDLEIVTWEKPQVTENTGHAVTLRSDFSSGQTFVVGETIVTYTAEDAEGNVNLCQFLVYVSVTAKFAGTEIPPQRSPGPFAISDSDKYFDDIDYEEDNDKHADQKYYYIGAGAGALVILLAVAAIILFLVCKRRRTVVVRKEDTPTTFDFPVECNLPPSYASVVKSTEVERSETDTKICYDNPVYMTNQSVTYSRQNDENDASDLRK